METMYKPVRGYILLFFSKKQLDSFNLINIIGDRQLVVADRFHPEEWSIEEATVYEVHESQQKLKKGQRVLIDYGIFSAGRYADERKAAELSRFVGWVDGGAVYYAYDDKHPYNVCEIFATLDEHDNIEAYHDCIICDKKKEETEKLVSVHQSVEEKYQALMPVCEWHRVIKSSVPEIVENNLILCEKGYSPTIKFRTFEMQYTTLPYIIGTWSEEEPLHVKLF